MQEKIIIDTDPGVDDALAIMLAIKNDCNIIGITTIFGNSNIDNTTKNTLKILSIIGKKIPVYKGIDKPLKVKNIHAVSHGIGGFGGYNQEINKDINISNKDAITFLIDSLEESKHKEITIICLGPCTNIAKLSILRPDLTKKIKSLIILGGSINQKGNITQYSEFNIYNDPDALKLILKLDIEKYLIPINVCRKVYFTKQDFENLTNPNISKPIIEITKHYIQYYQKNLEFGEFSGGVMYDLLATGFFIDKNLFTFKKSYIEVETKNKVNIGETYEKDSNISNCFLITDVDSKKLKKLFFENLNK